MLFLGHLSGSTIPMLRSPVPASRCYGVYSGALSKTLAAIAFEYTALPLSTTPVTFNVSGNFDSPRLRIHLVSRRCHINGARTPIVIQLCESYASPSRLPQSMSTASTSYSLPGPLPLRDGLVPCERFFVLLIIATALLLPMRSRRGRYVRRQAEIR